MYSTGVASAQASVTARRLLTPSVFVGATGVETGLDSGRNLSLTAGVDLSFHPVWRFKPALEYRGTLALDKGQVDSLKNNLFGIKGFTNLGRLEPYVDLLAGRIETTYAGSGYRLPDTNIFYTQSSSNLFAVGGGADFLATNHFAVRVDLQLQHASSPVTSSHSVHSATGMIGLVYTLTLGRGPR